MSRRVGWEEHISVPEGKQLEQCAQASHPWALTLLEEDIASSFSPWASCSSCPFGPWPQPTHHHPPLKAAPLGTAQCTFHPEVVPSHKIVKCLIKSPGPERQFWAPNGWACWKGKGYFLNNKQMTSLSKKKKTKKCPLSCKNSTLFYEMVNSGTVLGPGQKIHVVP